MVDEQSRIRHMSRRLDQKFKATLRGPRQAMRRFFGSSGALSDLFFSVMGSAFSREHQAVLFGIYKYEQAERAGDANWFLLRRNTHRLEKGLLMRPRRDVFALGYIDETVHAYERCHATSGCSDGGLAELRWAHDVLVEFFTVTISNPQLDAAQARFGALPSIETPEGACASRPYLRDLDAPRPVEYEDFQALSRRRRSVRWFLPKPVPRELLDKAVASAAEAPSACNRQPYEFRIFDDPALVEKVSVLPMGTAGFAHNLQTIVVVVGELRAYFHPRDRHIIYIDASLAAMGFMLALETLGLSSVPINWPDIPEREENMAEALGLEPDQRPVMLIAVGYPDPDGAVACSQKRSIEDLRSYNR